MIIYYAIKFFQITKYFKYTENSNEYKSLYSSHTILPYLILLFKEIKCFSCILWPILPSSETVCCSEVCTLPSCWRVHSLCCAVSINDMEQFFFALSFRSFPAVSPSAPCFFTWPPFSVTPASPPRSYFGNFCSFEPVLWQVLWRRELLWIPGDRKCKPLVYMMSHCSLTWLHVGPSHRTVRVLVYTCHSHLVLMKLSGF